MELARIDIPDHAPHVLVVDDDRRLRDLLARFLGENGYRVTTAAAPRRRGRRPRAFVFDALVLDVMMPGETGFDYARGLRRDLPGADPHAHRPRRPADRVTGLEIGADDYLPKPFEPRELILRLGNILKRAAPAPGAAAADAPESVRFGPFSFRFDRGELRREDEVVRITEREREILTILGHARPGQRAPRGTRRRRRRRQRAHRGRADQPPAPQDRDRSGQPGLPPDRARHRLPLVVDR
jgi:two-component system phosphate regulon response regulator OmpR